ncbi:helix-turn-helix domain-containing protein [Bacteroidota bacterium]
MSFFGKNVKKIRGVKGLSQQAFAELFSLKRATLGAYEEGRSEPKIDTMIKVANYFSISIDDILTKEITVNQLLSFNGGITTDVNQVVKAGFTDVPFVSELNSKMFIDDFKSTQSYSSLPKIKIPVDPSLDLLAFTVQDLYMVSNEEGLFPGDLVIGERISSDDLEKGDVVVVLVNDILLVRRYGESVKNHELLADHVNIPAITVSLDAVVYFWKVAHVFLKRYPKFTSNLEDRIDRIDARLRRLSSK